MGNTGADADAPHAQALAAVDGQLYAVGGGGSLVVEAYVTFLPILLQF